jgi:ferrous iron transport protein A
MMHTLSELRPGARAEVLAVTGEPGLVQRLYEFGLFEGEEIEVLALAPFGDPIEIRLGNTRLSLRKSEAAGVSVRPL